MADPSAPFLKVSLIFPGLRMIRGLVSDSCKRKTRVGAAPASRKKRGILGKNCTPASYRRKDVFSKIDMRTLKETKWAFSGTSWGRDKDYFSLCLWPGQMTENIRKLNFKSAGVRRTQGLESDSHKRSQESRAVHTLTEDSINRTTCKWTALPPRAKKFYVFHGWYQVMSRGNIYKVFSVSIWK